MRAGIFALALLVSAVSASAGACAPSGPTVALQSVDGRSVNVRVEIVSTPEALQRGLMWRTELPEDRGMLFVFGSDGPRSFWMKNTPLPLDIIFINSAKRVVSIAANTTPYSLESLPSAGPAKYVLEVNGGFCARHGIAAGASVTLPPLDDPKNR